MNNPPEIRPICVVPKQLHTLFGELEHAQLDIRSYEELYEAWSIAEREPVALLVSDSNAVGKGLFGLLTGLRLMLPDLIHLHLYDPEKMGDLVALVNRSGVIRLVDINRCEEALAGACSDALAVHRFHLRKDEEIQRLREANEQYEFMLRQSLLS